MPRKAAEVNKLGYATVEREWCEGDTIELVIPREFTTMRLNGKVSVSLGAIVMAIDERNQDIDVKVTDKITGAEPITTPFTSREAYKLTFSNGEGGPFRYRKAVIPLVTDKYFPGEILTRSEKRNDKKNF